MQLAILILFLLFICAEFVCHRIETKQLQTAQQAILNRLDGVEKKTDYRYFNTTRSLEEIHDVRIDTMTGSLRH